jgi:hypothetical protein
MNKRMKAGLAAGVAGAVVVGMSLLGTTAALADDAAPAPAAQEVASSPDTSTPESSPTSPSDTPAEESAPSTPVDAPASPPAESSDVPAPPTEQVTAPPADHIDSAADPIQQVAVAPQAADNAAGDEWFTWTLAVTTLPATDQGRVPVKASWFPQTPQGAGQLAAAPGTCIQQDHYKGPRHKLDALYAAPLTWNAEAGHAADNDIPGVKVLDWTISCTPPAPPVVNPQSCVPTGDWYSEDVAPAQTETGLLFSGQGAAVDWYHPISGNLQGFTSQGATFSDVAGYQPSITLVLNRDGTSGYANLVSEWYMNGGSASTDGTFTASASSVWWTNKIASGAGSQSDPQPLAFFAALWPNNQLLAVGPHLGSAQQSDTHSTVTAVSGCVSDSFAPTKPEPRTTTETSTNQECVTPADGTATLTEYGRDTTIPSVWSDETHGYVDGEPVVGEQYVISTSTVDDEDCAAVVIPPTETPTETPTTPPTTAPVATPQSPTPIAAVSDDTLAHTGTDVQGIAWTAGSLAILLMAAGSLLVFRRRHAER